MNEVECVKLDMRLESVEKDVEEIVTELKEFKKGLVKLIVGTVFASQITLGMMNHLTDSQFTVVIGLLKQVLIG
jgi:hypothetical protein